MTFNFTSYSLNLQQINTREYLMNINVAVRVSPLPQKEVALGYKSSVDLSNGFLHLAHPQDQALNKSYEFDHYFDEFASQQLIFEAIGQPLLQSCLDGYSCCMMFLGETGSGKSHSMFGEEGDKMGVVYKLVNRLLTIRSNAPTVKVSIIDISSNEKVYDCSAYKQTAEGKVKGQKIYGDQIGNINWKKISSLESFQDHIRLIQKNKAVLSSSTNQKDERFSTIITLDLKWKDGKSSYIKFVKMAGMEYLNVTKQGTKKHKSLDIFQTVLESLVQRQAGRKSVINYKQSVLTTSLKEALGGNCRTSLICTVNPSSRAFAVNSLTLNIGQLASKVGNRPVVVELEKVEVKSQSDSSSNSNGEKKEKREEDSCGDSE